MEKHKRTKIYIVIGVIVVVLLAVIIGLTSRKTRVPLNEFVSFNLYGYEGYGSLEARFDEKEFMDRYRGVIKPKNGYNIESMFEEIICGSADSPINLSNGDTVSWIWNCNDQYAKKYYNCILQYEDIDYSVSGLSELRYFDPFEGMDYELTGISPRGQIRLTKKQNEVPLEYVFNKSSDIKNGDVVTVKVESPDGSTIDDYCGRNYGVKLKMTEMDISIDSLPFYAQSASKISQEVLDKLIEDSNNAFSDEDKRTSDKIHFVSFEPVRYFIFTRSSDKQKWENIVPILFKVGVHGDYDYNDERNDFDYYYGTVFYNLILYPNNDSEYDIESKDRYNGMFVHDFKDKDSTLSFFSGTGVDFNGYSSLSDAITTIVERFENKEEYTKVDEVDLTSSNERDADSIEEDEGSVVSGEDATEYLMFQGKRIGYQTVDLAGNVYDKAVLSDDDANCLLLDGKFHKLHGKICLSEQSDTPARIRICILNEENANIDEYYNTRSIFNPDYTIIEETLEPDGTVIPFEIDVTDVYTVGFKSDLVEWRAWRPYMKVLITDLYLE